MNQFTEIAQSEKLPSKHKYIFPNFMAKMMANVDPKTQYESAMLSSFLILIGIFATGIMTMIFGNLTLAYKILIIVNCIGGLIYISSSLVTVYQQYSNYMDIMEIQKSMMSNSELNQKNSPKVKKKYNRKNQLIFFLGIIFIIFSLSLISSSVANACIKLIPLLTGKILYLGVLSFIIGLMMILMILKKGKNEIKKQNQIQKSIIEGKIDHPISNVESNKNVIVQPSLPKNTPNLKNRLRGLVAGIKIAKIKKQEQQEKVLTDKLQITLDEIKRLKHSERRTESNFNSMINERRL